jgi:hypothetical protein
MDFIPRDEARRNIVALDLLIADLREAKLDTIEKGASVNIDELFDADGYWRAGNCPWTIVAYPTSLADEHGLPPDDDAKRLFAELQTRGIQVGIWADAIRENTTYFACPKEDIQRLYETLKELEEHGALENGFCGKRSEYLLSLVGSGT